MKFLPLRLWRAGVVCLPLLAAITASANAADASQKRAPLGCTPAPLLQPGKAQLMERVLVRPDARLGSSPETANAEGGTLVPAFNVLYLYDRSADGKAVQVGARKNCQPQGWLKSESIIPWRHAMAVALANRTRNRLPFFETPDHVRALMQASDAEAQLNRLETTESGLGLVALEPKTPPDITSHFYLLPVLESTDVKFTDQLPARLLHLATISAQPDRENKAAPVDVRQNFRTAVVFVVDATKSTQPYIDRMHKALDTFYSTIEGTHSDDTIRFGLIGYRDDPEKVPGIEYLTRVFVDPNKVSTQKAFDQGASALKASKISSRADAEDGFSGVNAAIDGINWTGFAGRFIVMITDASSRNPGPLAKTPFDAHHTHLNAAAQGIALISVHLLTPEGSSQDHLEGAAQYREMTAYPGRNPLYFPVEAGDLNRFDTTIKTIAGSLIKLVTEVEDQGPIPGVDPIKSKAKDQNKKISEDIAAIGHAMRLAYLGKTNGSTIPSMFDSWSLDRDFVNHDTPTLIPGIFLTKGELSDLKSTVSQLAIAFNNAKNSPTTLYTELRSAALLLSRDPAALASGNDSDLRRAILGEYLEGLPYTSQVMATSQEQWNNMDPGDQQELIDGLAQKADLYQRAYDNVSGWVKLADTADDDDKVSLIPLDTLP